jgi:hypothetical protein
VRIAASRLATVPFLSRPQKRDILFENAARFLRLPKAAARKR